MEEMKMFNEENDGIDESKKKEDFIRELGVKICERLRLDSDNENVRKIGQDYWNWMIDKGILKESDKKYSNAIMIYVNEISTPIVPAYFIKYVMEELELDEQPVISEMLYVKDLIIHNAILKITLFLGVSPLDLEHEPFLINDAAGFSSHFIYINTLHKIGRISWPKIREFTDFIGEKSPIFFMAGYDYKICYDSTMYGKSSMYFYLPEKLESLYKKELNAINVNSYLGNYEESVSMCIFPKNKCFLSAKMKQLFFKCKDGRIKGTYSTKN
jgi:hypothetical protein